MTPCEGQKEPGFASALSALSSSNYCEICPLLVEPAPGMGIDDWVPNRCFTRDRRSNYECELDSLARRLRDVKHIVHRDTSTASL